MSKQHNIRVIISGGGTGGHIFPAISIANALKEIDPAIEILFVGASDRMEMERVPAAGYKIIGLPISGFQRRLTLKNLSFFVKLFRSLRKASTIIKDFNPHVAVGVGGYASGALLYVAANRKVPALIQEQNSYPGITNKLLKNKAEKICVAYSGMERFFPQEKIILTGNPVRQDILQIAGKKEEALEYFGLNKDKKVLLILGGSLGARTINQSLMKDLAGLSSEDIEVVWQTGKFYIEEVKAALENIPAANVHAMDFISRMDLAYACADVIISRAGAGTISELCLVGKACILVPSPNVAEDHQTKNAMALADQDAAILVRDKDAGAEMIEEALKLINDQTKQKELSENIEKMALKDSAKIIANEVLKLAKREKE
ncbi:MAG: undecaprenyldiphospho-muramoylpentapeptide beta-N-acetylglucosaminyltransferase [Bacteroidales bacterium]|nr:undecaprenyldiphospho-muramoylpentapeptide beta-N-acetylglucosaminyltransferase [Bacteroidales bacterium]MCF8454334.1 undecaprenyldiphospho-muramoylpentapeptide beta-N-acetylglucosaminyltransferase [Bacteroidales bacterium]